MDNAVHIELLEQFSDLLLAVKDKEDLQRLVDRVEQVKGQYTSEVLQPIYEALAIFKGPE